MKALFSFHRHLKAAHSWLLSLAAVVLMLTLTSADTKRPITIFMIGDSTMANKPLLYVHGNHDNLYDKYPPEGCECIDDRLVTVNGLRILGLGGSQRYKEGPYQYTERQMAWRIRKLER